MAAKVKITDIRSGQEYLLLVSKMNLKGILVESSHLLPLSTPVQIHLQIDDGKEPLLMEGMVHKITQRPGGGQGMIIRFVDPPNQALDRITAYAEQAQASGSGAAKAGMEVPLLSREKTMMVDANTLSKLTLSAVDEEEAAPATMDEEAVHAAHPGLAGETRIVSSDEFSTWSRRRRTPRTLRAFFVFLMVVVTIIGIVAAMRPILRGIESAVGIQQTPIPTSAPVVVAVAETPNADLSEELTTTPTEEPVATKTQKPRSETPTPKPTPVPQPKVSKLTSIRSEETGAFLKINLKVDGSVSKVVASRAMNPRRLIVDLPTVRSFSVEESISVNKNPLLRIRTAQKGQSVQVIFDLYPVDFPRYDVKEHGDSVDIFIHRQ